MKKHGRKTLLALVAVLLLAVLCSLLLWLSTDRLEAAQRRIRLGMDEAEAAATLGQPGEANMRKPDGTKARVLCWGYGDGWVYAILDDRAKVTHVSIRRDDRTLWQRVRGWGPW
jgi:hypothetical protein